MISFLLQFVLSNTLLTIPLALVAYAVQRSQRSPFLAHLLWLVVLIKIVTPPMFAVRMVPLPNVETPYFETHTVASEVHGNDVLVENESNRAIVEHPVSAEADQSELRPGYQVSLLSVFGGGVLAVWCCGSFFVSNRSLHILFRFNRLLRIGFRPVTLDTQRVAKNVAEKMGIRCCPEIYSTAAEIAPLVWWGGGRARIVLPQKVLQRLDSDQIQLILAHEMAHIKRRDHLVRWIEWLACVAFWWNPIVWWARSGLRSNEELCCDAMVLASLHPKPRRYGLLLLSVVELLSSSGIRPPAEACAVDSGGSLERRIRMIVSTNSVATLPRWLSRVALIFAIALLPIGIAYGQGSDAANGVADPPVAGVEITLPQVKTMTKTQKEVHEKEDFNNSTNDSQSGEITKNWMVKRSNDENVVDMSERLGIEWNERLSKNLSKKIDSQLGPKLSQEWSEKLSHKWSERLSQQWSEKINAELGPKLGKEWNEKLGEKLGREWNQKLNMKK